MANSKFPEHDLYITPDGESIRFDASGRFIQSYQGYGMAPIEYIFQQGPFQHGQSVVDYRLQSRIIQWVFRQNGCSRYDYWEKRDQILDTLRINRQTTDDLSLGVLRKLLPDGSKRDIDVILQAGPVFGSPTGVWDEWGFTDTLRFMAPDPTFYDPTEQSVIWTLDPGQTELAFPITFPIQFGHTLINASNPISYPGTWFAFPTIVIVGPLTGFRIINTNADEKIQLNREIKSGEVVTISLGYGNKTVTSSVHGNILGSVTLDSDLATFHIAPHPKAPNGVNTFEVLGSGAHTNTQVTLSYFVRYIGI